MWKLGGFRQSLLRNGGCTRPSHEERSYDGYMRPPILVPESESGASSTTLRPLYSKADNLRVAASSLQDVAQPAKSMLRYVVRHGSQYRTVQGRFGQVSEEWRSFKLSLYSKLGSDGCWMDGWMDACLHSRH